MNSKYQDCIDKCLECAAVCNYCAASCLNEQHVDHMRRCIQLDLECEAICYTSAKIMAMDGEHAKEVCSVCAAICESCADECSKHDNHHCQECATICRECSDICKSMAA